MVTATSIIQTHEETSMTNLEQTFQAVKTLWPDTKYIEPMMGAERRGGSIVINRCDNNDVHYTIGYVSVDWPAEITRWPVPEPKQWRQAEMPQDFKAKARFKNKCESVWQEGVVVGYAYDVGRWVNSIGQTWDLAEVEIENKPDHIDVTEILGFSKGDWVILKSIDSTWPGWVEDMYFTVGSKGYVESISYIEHQNTTYACALVSFLSGRSYWYRLESLTKISKT